MSVLTKCLMENYRLKDIAVSALVDDNESSMVFTKGAKVQLNERMDWEVKG